MSGFRVSGLGRPCFRGLDPRRVYLKRVHSWVMVQWFGLSGAWLSAEVGKLRRDEGWGGSFFRLRV